MSDPSGYINVALREHAGHRPFQPLVRIGRLVLFGSRVRLARLSLLTGWANRTPAGLPGQERQADAAARVVVVEVDQADALTGAEQQPAACDGHGQGRPGEDRQEMVGAMTAAAVTVHVAVVPRKEALEHRLEVL